MNGKLAKAGLEGTSLTIIQGDATDIKAIKNEMTSSSVKDIYQVAQTTISRQNSTIDSLRYALREKDLADTIGSVIGPELEVLFPQVANIAVTNPIFNSIKTGSLDSTHVVLVKYASPMGNAIQQKFVKYLEARLGYKDIEIVNVGNSISFPSQKDNKPTDKK